MSNKTNETKKQSVTEQTKGKLPLIGELTPFKLTALICAVVILGLLIAGAIILIVDAVKMDAGFSYRDSDMTKYIEISDADYKNFTLDIAISSNVEADAAQTITSLLNKHKPEKPLGGGKITYDPAAKITAGDEVRILYLGCTVDEDGNPVDFIEGMNNIAGTAPLSLKGTEKKLVIGSSSFIAGFESGLEGKTLADFPFVTPVISGTIDTSKHVLFVSYTRLEDGKTSNETKSYVLIYPALGKEKIDATYGDGFYDKIMAAELDAKGGTNIADSSEKLGKYTYSSIKVSYAIDFSTAAYIEVHFPYDYGNSDELKNKNAKFYVFTNGMKEYYDDSKGEGVFDDAFVTDKILADEDAEITAEELAAKYPDITSVAEQYKKYVYDNLAAEYEKELQNAIFSSAISRLVSKATVKKIPEKLRDSERARYVEAFKAQYQNVLETYGPYGYTESNYPIETYAKSYFGISDGKLWKEEVYKIADGEMKKQMVIHYILQREDVDLSDSVMSAKIEEIIEEYYGEYENYYFQINTDEKREDYDGKEAELREKVVDMMYDYFEDGFFENEAYYRLAVEHAVENFGITINTADPKVE